MFPLARLALRSASLTTLGISLCLATADAQSFGPDFVNDFTFSSLGQPTGIPSPLGGINFKPGDTNTLLIGGAANSLGGALYSIGVVRNAQNHITAFNGTAVKVADAQNIDGGVDFEPSSGVLFYTGYSNNVMGQLEPGSTTPDKVINLTGLNISSSVGSVVFVPPGFAGAGKMKIASFNANTWYDADRTPDGNGTFDITNVVLRSTIQGGVEGMVYIHGGNPGFAVDSVLVSEWSAGRVGVYDIDANGDPINATRRDFMSSLSGAEGAIIDPVTGDFLFSTFGGGDKVIAVEGFDAPTIYCNAKVNSINCTASIGYSGAPSLAGADNFVISVSNLLNQKSGVQLWGLAPALTPFAGGTLCVNAPLRRIPLKTSGGSPKGTLDCSGSMAYDWKHAFMSSKGLVAGTNVYVQFMYRDNGFLDPNNLVLSNALRFSVTP